MNARCMCVCVSVNSYTHIRRYQLRIYEISDALKFCVKSVEKKTKHISRAKTQLKKSDLSEKFLKCANYG